MEPVALTPQSPVAAVLSNASRWHVEQGDALEVLRTIPSHSLDAIVCDPPAGIAFMGAAWDRDKGGRRQWIDWLASIMAEALRVVKPGAHALVWALPRTSHWTATALEDAGWEIRDCIVHMQGQGFPKHDDALKPSQEHWWLVRAPLSESSVKANVARWGTGGLDVDGCRVGTSKSIPHSPASRNLADLGCGWGLKASEDTDGRDPNIGRWPPNAVFSHADGCERVGERKVKAGNKGEEFIAGRAGNAHAYGAATIRTGRGHGSPDGTETVDDWHCAEGCPVAELAAQSGVTKSGGGSAVRGARTGKGMGFHGAKAGSIVSSMGDVGTAARFFPQFAPDALEPLSDLLAFPFVYASKTRRTERNAGCDALAEKPSDPYAGHRHRRMEGEPVRMDGAPSARSANHHPTVKPLALMRWFVRLVTPAGGVVLDMFGGSGSTGCAAVLEHRRALLIEKEVDFAAIARARVAHWILKAGESIESIESGSASSPAAPVEQPTPAPSAPSVPVVASASASAPAPAPKPSPSRGQLPLFG